MVVSLYVHDMLYAGSSIELVSDFKWAIMNKFDMTDLGELHYFLGLEVSQTNEGIFVCQQKYTKDLLKKFNIEKCKVVASPINTNEKLQLEDGVKDADQHRFRSLVGRLIYLTHTCPDISFVVGLVSRFMHRPSKHHMGAAVRIL